MTNRIVSVAVMMLVATSAHAQEAASRPGLDLKALSTVYVLDDRGAETTGKLLRLDEDAILVLVNGQERRFALGQVLKVDKRGDSLKNGAITGAVLGAVMGVLTSGMADCRTSAGHYGSCGAGTRFAIMLVSAGLYGAVGAGIDAAIPGRTTLYRKPMLVAAVSPDRRGASVGVSVRW